jgi:hypothetical protein
MTRARHRAVSRWMMEIAVTAAIVGAAYEYGNEPLILRVGTWVLAGLLCLGGLLGLITASWRHPTERNHAHDR